MTMTLTTIVILIITITTTITITITIAIAIGIRKCDRQSHRAKSSANVLAQTFEAWVEFVELLHQRRALEALQLARRESQAAAEKSQSAAAKQMERCVEVFRAPVGAIRTGLHAMLSKRVILKRLPQAGYFFPSTFVCVAGFPAT